MEQVVDQVVVTAPAYFNDFQRQATKQAAFMAGFRIVNIINEPTAAALAFTHYNPKNYKRNILVYDFGGGTFDVSIVTVRRGECIVRATMGNYYLGGKDIDNNLYNYIKKDFKNQYSFDINENETDIRRLKNICEYVKRIFSSNKVTCEIELSMLSDKNYFTVISRDEFDELNKNLFEETLEITKKCLTESGISKDDVDEVVLVGGSSRNIKVQDMLKDYFGENKLSHGINPDEAVAYGAAIHARNLQGNKSEITDVNSVSLGIELLDESFSKIILKNTPVPTQKTQTYCTISKNASIDVYQGESHIAKENFKLGSFVLKNVNHRPVDVTFEIDAEGILKVTSVSKIKENNTKSIVINILGLGLTSKQIMEHTHEIKAHRENEVKRKEFYESKWELEMLCEIISANAKKNGDKKEVLQDCLEICDWLKNITIADKAEMSSKISSLQKYL